MMSKLYFQSMWEVISGDVRYAKIRKKEISKAIDNCNNRQAERCHHSHSVDFCWMNNVSCNVVCVVSERWLTTSLLVSCCRRQSRSTRRHQTWPSRPLTAALMLAAASTDGRHVMNNTSTQSNTHTHTHRHLIVSPSPQIRQTAA